jgi:pyrimidine-nucleoside phosphorylase
MSKVEEVLKDGRAFEKLREVVIAQGGNVDLIDNPDHFKKATRVIPVYSNESGYITKMNAEEIGKISVRLGAGRLKKEDSIDFSAGIILKKKVGDKVEEGEIIAELYTSKEKNLDELTKMYMDAITISQENNVDYKLIYDIIK